MSDDRSEFIRTQKIYDRAALAIGHLTMSWNDVHSVIFQIFRCMSGMRVVQADAVFFSLKADAAQRDMTGALARETLAGDDLADLLERLKTIGKLAAVRNAAIHTSWFVKAGSDLPTPFLRLKPPAAIQEDAITQFEQLHLQLVDEYLALSAIRDRIAPASWLDTSPPPRGVLEAIQLGSVLPTPSQNTAPPPRPSRAKAPPQKK